MNNDNEKSDKYLVTSESGDKNNDEKQLPCVKNKKREDDSNKNLVTSENDDKHDDEKQLPCVKNENGEDGSNENLLTSENDDKYDDEKQLPCVKNEKGKDDSNKKLFTNESDGENNDKNQILCVKNEKRMDDNNEKLSIGTDDDETDNKKQLTCAKNEEKDANTNENTNNNKMCHEIKVVNDKREQPQSRRYVPPAMRGMKQPKIRVRTVEEINSQYEELLTPEILTKYCMPDWMAAPDANELPKFELLIPSKFQPKILPSILHSTLTKFQDLPAIPHTIPPKFQSQNFPTSPQEIPTTKNLAMYQEIPVGLAKIDKVYSKWREEKRGKATDAMEDSPPDDKTNNFSSLRNRRQRLNPTNNLEDNSQENIWQERK